MTTSPASPAPGATHGSPRNPQLQAVISVELKKAKNSMCDLRGKIQRKIDTFDVSWIVIQNLGSSFILVWCVWIWGTLNEWNHA